MRDLHNNIAPVSAINPQAIAANATTNGASIDLVGFTAAEVLFVSGNLVDGTYACKLQDCDDNATWVDVPAGKLLGAAPSFAATDDNLVKSVGYVGAKRYLRAVITTTGVTTGGTIGAVVIKGHGRHLAGVAV
jgi:hypothetical protein